MNLFQLAVGEISIANKAEYVQLKAFLLFQYVKKSHKSLKNTVQIIEIK